MKQYLRIFWLVIIAVGVLSVSAGAAEVYSGAYPVSNIRFETVNGEARLCWDATSCEGCTYQVSFSEYGGGFWEKWYTGTASSTRALNPYKPMATKGIRVQTLLSGAVVGETTNNAMRVEIQHESLYLGVSGMVQVEADGYLTYQVTGLLPNAKTSFTLRTYGGKNYYTVNPSTNGAGILGYTDRFSGKTAANMNLSDLYAEISLYTDPVVSGDGMTFSYTQTKPMNLIQMVEGDIPEEGEGEFAEGEAPVSNLRFELIDTHPHLCWDDAEGISNVSYNAFLSEDGGETWEAWESGLTSAQLDVFRNPWAGKANAIRIETVAGGEIIGTFTDINMTLSETQEQGFNWVYGMVKKDSYPYFHAQIEGLEPDCFVHLSFQSVTGRVLISEFVTADEKGSWSGLVDQTDAVIDLKNLYIAAESFGNARITEKTLEYTRYSHGDGEKLEYDQPPKVWVEDVPVLTDEYFMLTDRPGMLYGTFYVPQEYDQEGEYTLYFYDSEDRTMAPGIIFDLQPGTTVSLDVISSRADRLRIYESRPDGSYVDAMPVGEVVLKKPIIEESERFPFPHERIEGVGVKQAEDSYLYTFEGLDFSRYHYSLYNSNISTKRNITSEQFLGSSDWLGDDLTLTATLMVEAEDAYRICYSEPETVRVAKGIGSYCPLKDRPTVIPNVGQNGYDFSFDLNDDYPKISLIVPGERDDKEGYCLILYSSVKDCEHLTLYYNEYISVWSLIQYHEGVLDRGRVLKGTNTSYKDPDAVILADWELEKPIVSLADDFALHGGLYLDVYHESTDGIRYEMLGGQTQYSYMAIEPEERVVQSLGKGGELQSFYVNNEWNSEGVEVYASYAEETEDQYVIHLSDRVLLDYSGTVSAPSRSGGAVQGSVTGGDGAQAFLVRAGETVAEAVVKSGTFRINADSGLYDVVIKKDGQLTWTIRNVKVGGGSVTLPKVAMLSGDINGDGMINARDISEFRRDFGKTADAAKNHCTDLNGDGMVNARDITVLRKNFGKSAVKNCTMNYSE